MADINFPYTDSGFMERAHDEPEGLHVQEEGACPPKGLPIQEEETYRHEGIPVQEDDRTYSVPVVPKSEPTDATPLSIPPKKPPPPLEEYLMYVTGILDKKPKPSSYAPEKFERKLKKKHLKDQTKFDMEGMEALQAMCSMSQNDKLTDSQKKKRKPRGVAEDTSLPMAKLPSNILGSCNTRSSQEWSLSSNFGSMVD
ncbi:unnamed protein product [Calypogeia fissa]